MIDFARELIMELLTNTQKRVAQAIVNVFETGSVGGDYSKVTLIPGDTGQLTYGRSQTTLSSGNLSELIAGYCGRPGARFATALTPFLPALEAKEPALNDDLHFKNILRAGADDVVMRDTQDEFFDTRYWEPAVRVARRDGIDTPLGVAVVYDSKIHGSWGAMRRRVNDARGSAAEVGERAWIAAYLDTRHDWLANHRRSDLRRTVYRMETFRGLIDADAWMLEMPLLVRGLEINQQTLSATPPNVYDSPEPGSRQLVVTSPLQRGLDVRWVQLALSGAGRRLGADGIYGGQSRRSMQAFQRERGLAVTGRVDNADFEALGL